MYKVSLIGNHAKIIFNAKKFDLIFIGTNEYIHMNTYM